MLPGSPHLPPPRRRKPCRCAGWRPACGPFWRSGRKFSPRRTHSSGAPYRGIPRPPAPPARQRCPAAGRLHILLLGAPVFCGAFLETYGFLLLFIVIRACEGRAAVFFPAEGLFYQNPALNVDVITVGGVAIYTGKATSSECVVSLSVPGVYIMRVNGVCKSFVY